MPWWPLCWPEPGHSSQVRERRSLSSPKKGSVSRKMCLIEAHFSTRLAPPILLILVKGIAMAQIT